MKKPNPVKGKGSAQRNRAAAKSSSISGLRSKYRARADQAADAGDFSLAAYWTSKAESV